MKKSLTLAATVVSQIPLAALAGVLMVTAVRMVSVRTARTVMSASRADAVIFLVTAGITVAFDLIIAVIVGVVCAAVLALRALARSGTAVREPLPGEAVEGDEHIALFRLDGAMFFLAGLPMFWILVLGGLAVCGGFSAYFVFDHVAGRINRFMTGEGDTFQVDAGREAILRGGWFGQGPGEGTVKRIIPDSHTDFIFSVAAEEYGIILCMIIMLLFAFIVVRGLSIALKERDAFTRLAVSGIVILFGFQSIINMAVNLHLMPAKGMTLPFISYGGSSLVAIAITMGILLALTRRRPEARMTHTVGHIGSNRGERIPAL